MRFLFLYMPLFLFMFLLPLPAKAQCTDPDRAIGQIVYNKSWGVFQGCTPKGWIGFNKPTRTPPDCPNIGDPCMSGIIYAGEYAGHKLYVTGADAPGTYSLNNALGSWRNLDDAFVPDCPRLGTPRNGNRRSDQSNPACMGAQGPAFTEYMANFTGKDSPYKAAIYCYHLGKASDPTGANNPLAHGHDDWYLPAIDELEFIYDNIGPQPNHGFQNAVYWSSAERDAMYGWAQNFADGSTGNVGKDKVYSVRCFRR